MRLPVPVSLALLGLAGCVTTYRGIAFSDRNGDGQRQDDEPGLANAVVAYGHGVFGTTDGNGAFDLTVMSGAEGVVWLRVPEGFTPGPVWQRIGATTQSIQLGAKPFDQAPAAGEPLTFVLASDSHVSPTQPFGPDFGQKLAMMQRLAPAPAFVVVTGDITQNTAVQDFDLVDVGVGELRVPYVPVPGNHDWYDGGGTYVSRSGPDNYSFDLGGVHFVVWNMMMPEAEIHTYLGLELERVPADMPVVAMSHAPPIPSIIATLKSLGVDYVLSGHTHTNRVVDHGGMIELTTEPLMMGGLDQLPGGYRVVTLNDGELTAYHRTTVDEPQVAVMTPNAATCVARTGGRIVVAAELDASIPTATATIDCGAPVALTGVGGWNFTGPLPALDPGWHSLHVDIRSASGGREVRTSSFEVCDETAPPTPTATWPQTGGGPTHLGASAAPITPPLAPRWTAAVGGHVVHAPPVVADGAVFVTATDLGDGTTGGLVAFDLATGAERWRVTTPFPVRGAPAVVGTVVAVGMLEGTILAFDTRTGDEVWQAPLGEGIDPEAASFFASAAADGTAFLLGNQRRLAALDATTGTAQWTVDPVPDGRYSQSLAAVAVAPPSATVPGGAVIGVFHRDQGGLVAYNRDTGTERWRKLDGQVLGIEATPIVNGDTTYIVNGATDVTALATASGAARWTRRLDPTGFEWGQASVGTPALASGTLVVPTMLRDLVALDAATGAEKWRFAGRPSPLRTNHYFGRGQAGFESGPVITGAPGSELVWAADTSGRLVALQLATGALVWETELGAPVLAGLAAAGDWLVVASYDGTVRVLAPTTRTPAPPAPQVCAFADGAGTDDDVDEPAGCCNTDGAAGLSPLVGLGVIGLLLRRRRRRT